MSQEQRKAFEEAAAEAWNVWVRNDAVEVLSEAETETALVGSLQWLVAQVRVDMGFQLSVLHSESATVGTIIRANALVKEFKATFALKFRPLDLEGAGIVVVSDASLGNVAKRGDVLGYPSPLAQAALEAQLAAVPRDARILPQQAMFFNAPGVTPAQAMKAGLLTTPVEQGAEWRPSPPPGIPSPTQVASEGAHDTYSPTTPGEEVTLPEEAQKVSARRSRRGGKLEAGDSSRYWCSFHLLQAYAQFSVVPAMIGKRGVNTRTIFDKTGAKIRVRGRGSGHMESQTGKEAPAGLMVTVSSHRSDWNGFVEAVKLTGELIDRVQNQMYEKMGRSLGELCFEVALHDGGVYRLKEGKLVTEDCSARAQCFSRPHRQELDSFLISFTMESCCSWGSVHDDVILLVLLAKYANSPRRMTALAA
eukprot:s3879_g7.t1